MMSVSYLPAVLSSVLSRTEKEKSIGVCIAGLQTSTQTVTVLFSSWTLYAVLSSFNTASVEMGHGHCHEYVYIHPSTYSPSEGSSMTVSVPDAVLTMILLSRSSVLPSRYVYLFVSSSCSSSSIGTDMHELKEHGLNAIGKSSVIGKRIINILISNDRQLTPIN